MEAVIENSFSFMRRRRVLLVIFVLIVLAVGVAMYFTRRSPPLVWQGKPSVYWIGRLSFYDLDSAGVSGVSAEIGRAHV